MQRILFSAFLVFTLSLLGTDAAAQMGPSRVEVALTSGSRAGSGSVQPPITCAFGAMCSANPLTPTESVSVSERWWDSSVPAMAPVERKSIHAGDDVA